MDLVEQHLSRVETALLKGYSLATAADWILEHTFLKGGEHYSYLDHEFQEVIARDLASEIAVRKCSQIGLSELSARIALAFCNTMPGFTVMYTLPTAKFATKFTKTRIDVIIDGSPTLRDRINTNMNSAEVKQFRDSFLYVNGTMGAKAAISVPADCLIHDELDFSDLEVVSNYESRLTHSKFKLKRKFSTPTVNGIGISQEFETSRKHWNFVHCCHCSERFLPDYEKHVKIPGYTGELRAINSENLWKVRWREARLECPSCGKEPDLSPQYREWVVENTEYTGDKHGYQVQPFDAPKIVTAADLVKSSTRYERWADFVNFSLGRPCEDLETSFSEEELKDLFKPRPPEFAFEPYAYVMGIDVGLMCHIIVAGVGPEGRLDVVHAERVTHTELERRKGELYAMYKVRVVVMDSQPYFDMLLRMQARDRNLWGAVYSQKKDLDVMRVVDQEQDDEEGKQRRHMLDINRNRAFDALMEMVRGGALAMRGNAEGLKDLIIRHLKDMKRVKEFDGNDDLVFAWRKSASGQDHFHHTLLYAYLASRLLGTVQSVVILPFGGLTSFKLKEQDMPGTKMKARTM